MIVGCEREALQAGLLEVAGIVDAYVVIHRELQQLRNFKGWCTLADGQKHQLLPNLLSALQGQFAANYTFPQCVCYLYPPNGWNDCDVERSLEASQGRVSIRRRAIQETPCQRKRIGGVQNECAHSRPSAISSLMETSSRVRPLRSSQRRDLRGGKELCSEAARAIRISPTHSSTDRPLASASARNVRSTSGGRFSVTVMTAFQFSGYLYPTSFHSHSSGAWLPWVGPPAPSRSQALGFPGYSTPRRNPYERRGSTSPQPLRMATAILSQDEQIHWLALTGVPGLGDR